MLLKMFRKNADPYNDHYLNKTADAEGYEKDE